MASRPRPRRRAAPTSARRAPGALMTPTCSSPSALDGQQRPEQRHAAHEVVGPVDRVDVPADDARPPRVPYSSPTRPWSGIRSAIRSRISRSMAVSAWVTNVRSGLVSMTRSRRKCAQRDRVRLVAAGQRDVEPAAQLGVVPRRAPPTSRRRRRSRADPRALGVVQRLAGDLEADPLAEHLDLAARPDRRRSGGR